MLKALETSLMCRAAAGCDLSPEKRAAAAALQVPVHADYAEMLARPDVDIVAIYTPDELHCEHIKMAFEAGKHVVCTKPLLDSTRQAGELREAARQNGLRLQVGQSTRFGEPFLRQREEFLKGAFGEIEVVDAHYNHEMAWFYEKSPWSVDRAHWAFLGLSHPIDLVCWYLGPIREVHAYGMVTAMGRRHGLANPDAITVNMISEAGQLGRVLGNYGFHDLRRARSLIECFLMGTKGSSLARYPELRFTHHDEAGVEREEDYTLAMTGYYYRHELAGMHYGEFCNIIDSFAQAIVTGSPNSPDLEEGLATVAVMEAVVRSLESGRAEPVQL